MSASLDGRDINELRVVDLKAELEKRGLDKSGNKQVLLERLQKAIQVASSEPTKPKEAKAEDEVTEMTEETTNGADKSVVDTSGDVLNLNSSMEMPEKKDTSEKTITTEETVVKDAATTEEDAVSARAVKTDADGATGAVATSNGATGADEERKEGAQAEKAVGESKEDDGKQPEDPIDGDADVDGDVDMKEDDKLDELDDQRSPTGDQAKKENGEEAPAPAVNGTSSGDEKKPEKKAASNSTPATTASAAGAGAKDGKKEADQGEKNSTSPSKIKERLVHDQNRNLWITNISQTTRATELKQALSEHGKVVGAKVVINARHPAACCYGYVRMETVADADNCIAKLNNTELNGQIIRIEKVRPDHLNPSAKAKPDAPTKEKPSQKTPVRAPTPAKDDKEKKERKPVEAPSKDDKKDKLGKGDDRKSAGGAAAAAKAAEKDKEKDKRESKDNGRGKEKERRRTRSHSRDRQPNKARADSANRAARPPVRHGVPPRKEVPQVRKEKDILTFDKIKTERERERLREREREMRMRRREESERVKEIERRQRSEEARLERERQKIKEERERLERERAELLALERERQKREREKIELERLELQRAKMRMQEEERRAIKRPASGGFRERERSYEERKRSVTDRHFAEAPPPPRFDGPSSIKVRDASPPMKKFSSSSSASKDYKRLSYEKRDPYPPKRDYDERTHSSSSMSRASGSAPVPKYESSSSSYSRDRDMRTGADPRGGSGGIRSSSSGGMQVSSSKYNSSEGKVRYTERERERSPHFTSRSNIRDERDRRPVSDTKSDMRSSRDHRYPEPKVDSVRYERTSSSSSASWSQHQKFTPSSATPNKPWSKEAWRSSDATPSSGDRWNPVSRPSIPFSSNPSMSLGPSCPPPPGINSYVNDRFDYKSNMSNMRKY